jgi:hypothetical protein
MQPDSSSIPAESSERTHVRLLAVVLAVAFGARLWMALSAPRFFDDHYVLNNVMPFLNGSLQPRHSYYGTLSYLPQAIFLKVCDLLHSRTGLAALAVRGTHIEGFTLGAFRIMRMFVVFYALVSLWVIYLAGRRLFSPAAGLAAAAVLAAYPQHVRSSIQLKPDMMALMLTLITLYWTAEAVRSPRLSRFVRSGVGVGLAASAKYIGLASCLPLTVWSLWAGLRDRRLWARLVLAGLASIATFLVLNPFFGEVLHFGNRLVWYYGQRAHQEESGHLEVVRGELDFMVFQHGWLLGACLLLGAFLLARRLRFRGEEERAAAVLPLSLALVYPVIHALGMTLFYPHNLLPALGGTALVCACGMVRGGWWLLDRPAAARSSVAVFLVWALPGVFLLARPFVYAYGQLTPDNWRVAQTVLRAELGALEIRHVAYEPEDVRLGLAKGGQRTALTAVPSLDTLPPALLDLTDAEAFPLSRTRGAHAAFYQGRRRRLTPACAREIHASPFRSQGPPLLLLLHPWTPAGDAVPVDLQRSAPGTLTARLPAPVAAGDMASLELLWPDADETPVERLQLGGGDLPLIYAGGRGQRLRYLTPRFRYAAGDDEVRIPVSPQAHPRSFRLRLWRWSQGACRGQARPAP